MELINEFQQMNGVWFVISKGEKVQLMPELLTEEIVVKIFSKLHPQHTVIRRPTPTTTMLWQVTAKYVQPFGPLYFMQRITFENNVPMLAEIAVISDPENVEQGLVFVPTPSFEILTR